MERRGEILMKSMTIQERWEVMGEKAILKEIGKDENEFLYFNR